MDAPAPPPPAVPASGAPRCPRPGCTGTSFNGRQGGHCSRRCHEAGVRRGCRLSFGMPLLPGDPKFDEVERQFAQTWRSSPEMGPNGPRRAWPAPKIRVMYSVRQWDGPLELQHEEYCQEIGTVAVHGRGRNPGNQQRRFHATTMNCDFSGTPCRDPTCAVCCIIKDGFKLECAGATGSWFGRGLYSTATPSEAYHFGNKRAMFVVNVACGKPEISKGSGPLPAGTHSRIVHVAHDECVVFDERAMVPRYLLVFA